MAKSLLPLGSVVYLEEGTEKLMIVGRGVIYNDQEEGRQVYTDYMGCVYPTGIDPEQSFFFNEENIDKVVFEGLKGEEEDRFLELYQEWEETLRVPKKMIK